MNEIQNNLKRLPKISPFLVFSGFYKELESEFSNSLISYSLGLLRFTYVTCFIFYSIFGIIDIYSNPLSYHLSWLINLYIAVCFAFTFINFFKKIIRFSLFLFVIISVSGFLTIVSIADVNSREYPVYFTGLVLIIIAIYTCLRLRFILASASCFFLIAFYEFINILIKNVFLFPGENIIFFNNSFMLIGVNTLGMIACFFIEYYMRHAFLLRKRIQYEEELKNLLAKKELIQTKHERDLIKNIDTLKNDFMANVTHEFRTPLTLIIGPLEAILSENYGKMIYCDDEKIKMVYYNGLKLLKLINNLLDYAKIEAHKMQINNKTIDIIRLLKFYVASVKPNADSKEISIVFNNNINEQFQDEFIVCIDKELFEKSIFNLISNSLKFTPSGGQIIVQLDKSDDNFSVSVRDTGVGIPDDQLDIIFERFTQLDKSATRKHEGTGIGLALTKEMVQLMGGKISVKSAVNKETTFTLSFPYDNNKIKKNELVNDIETETQLFNEFIFNSMDNINISAGMNINDNLIKRKILVVEDNLDMQKYLKSILENKYMVIFANNGVEGLRKVKKEKPDLVLTDVMMPEMNGFEMTEAIKKNDDFFNIPIIFLTAKTEIEMIIEGLKKGANDYIIKPFNSDELLARIEAQFSMKTANDKLLRQKTALQDVLQEKISSEFELQKSENKLVDIIDTLPVAIIEEDLNNKIVYINQYARNLLQINSYKNESFSNFIDISEKEDFINRISKMSNSEMFDINEYKLFLKNNDKLSAIIKSLPFYENNQQIGIRYILMEINPSQNLTLLNNDFFEKFKITKREKEVLSFLLQGYRYKDISEKLLLSEATIKKHVSNTFYKTKVKNKSELLKLIKTI